MDRTKQLQNIPLSTSAQEFADSHKELYKGLLLNFEKQSLTHLFSLMQNPRKYKTSEGSDEFYDFLAELVPAYLKTANGWTDANLAHEYDDYLNDYDSKYNRPRIKTCHNCGADLTEDFALNLTTDALLNDDKVLVICPKCSTKNYFNPKFD